VLAQLIGLGADHRIEDYIGEGGSDLTQVSIRNDTFRAIIEFDFGLLFALTDDFARPIRISDVIDPVTTLISGTRLSI
jgi:hypothetical protein